MKLTRNFFPLLALLLVSSLALAQQDAQYTQFMYNKLSYNPAYSGAEETPTVRAILRQQWLGLEGAPSSQLATFNAPLTASGTGIGARFSRVTIGLEQQYTVEGSYAYRIDLGRGHRFAAGVSASARYFDVDYEDATPVQGGGIDPSIPLASASKVLPNFGFGLYLDGPNYYVGMSLPRLLENSIDLADERTIISREARHYYFMGGYTFELNGTLKLQPQALVKIVDGAPFDADINVTAYIGRSLYTGLSYRLGGDGGGESGSALVGFMVGEHLTLGLTYDMGLSELRTQQSGSVEALIKYSFGGISDAGEVVDPRDLR